MIPNMGKLAGRTIFITGASRGIGKSIAEKCAKDGANIVIAAKTIKPHPKLPGTIHSAASEIEKLGGQCLPCEVDIRDEAQVAKAVTAAVERFGGIDILINNASAISLTNTELTDMKKYDLMNGVNARGTYLCSKYCLPHLKKGKNPHILNISPPLNMNKKWFKGHVAYTMAKYGMSMCVLGMSEEFKQDKIRVNALWPRTAIYTAAMEMLSGESVKNQCRKPDIMADAAYIIITSEDHKNTGYFFVDDEVLSGAGLTNLDAYSYESNATLIQDFFLDDSPNAPQILQPVAKSATVVAAASQATLGGDAVGKIIDSVRTIINEEVVNSVGAVFLFKLKDGTPLYMNLKSNPGSVDRGEPPAPLKVDTTLTLTTDDFGKLFTGKMNATSAFMSGKLKIDGNMGKAMKLEKIIKSINKSKL